MEAGVSTEPLSLRAYARHRNMALFAVQKAVKDGRLQASIVYVEGKPKIADVALADKEWAANTDQSKPKNSVSGNPKMKRGEIAGPPSASEKEAEKEASDKSQTNQTFAKARAIREQFSAAIAKLDYDERTGKLILADNVRSTAFNASRRAREMLYTIPDRISPLFPEIQHELHAVLLEEIERVCRHLASAKTY